MKKIIAVLFMMTLSLSSCDMFSSKTEDAATTTTAQTGSITINNTSTSGYTIYYLYISLTTSTTWGTDQLGTSTILQGSSFTITDIPVGTYDIKVSNSTGSACQYALDEPVTAGVNTTYYVYSGYWVTCSYRTERTGGTGSNVEKTGTETEGIFIDDSEAAQ